MPEVNLSDIPELMPGAHSSTNPAQRVEFEERCRELYAERMEEQHAGTPAPETGATVSELEAMFPNLDSALVQVLVADAATPQQALETLLALASAASDEFLGPPLPSKDIGLQDLEAFPSLVDADGWQVSSQQMFERGLEDDLGSAWCDRAKAGASMPLPRQVARVPATLNVKKRSAKQGKVSNLVLDTELPETEYEVRHRLRKQRLSNRARFHTTRETPSIPVDVASTVSAVTCDEEQSVCAENDAPEDM